MFLFCSCLCHRPYSKYLLLAQGPVPKGVGPRTGTGVGPVTGSSCWSRDWFHWCLRRSGLTPKGLTPKGPAPKGQTPKGPAPILARTSTACACAGWDQHQGWSKDQFRSHLHRLGPALGLVLGLVPLALMLVGTGPAPLAHKRATFVDLIFR